jgi:hypothetical protein
MENVVLHSSPYFYNWFLGFHSYSAVFSWTITGKETRKQWQYCEL